VSDIGIRLDGLLLGMIMAAGAGLFAMIAAVSAVRALAFRPGPSRSWKVAARSSGLAFVHVLGLTLLVAYLGEYGTPIAGPDWIDWLSVPWLGFVLGGLALLVRSRTTTSLPGAD
jgi:hypothetical protein